MKNLIYLLSNFLSFYCISERPDVFFVGKLLRKDENEALFALTSTDGKPDGFCLCPLTRIFRVEWDSNYLNSLSITEDSFECIPCADSCWNTFAEFVCKNHMTFCRYRRTGKQFLRAIQHDNSQILAIPLRRDGTPGSEVVLRRRNEEVLLCDSVQCCAFGGKQP